MKDSERIWKAHTNQHGVRYYIPTNDKEEAEIRIERFKDYGIKSN